MFFLRMYFWPPSVMNNTAPSEIQHLVSFRTTFRPMISRYRRRCEDQSDLLLLLGIGPNFWVCEAFYEKITRHAWHNQFVISVSHWFLPIRILYNFRLFFLALWQTLLFYLLFQFMDHVCLELNEIIEIVDLIHHSLLAKHSKFTPSTAVVTDDVLWWTILPMVWLQPNSTIGRLFDLCPSILLTGFF